MHHALCRLSLCLIGALAIFAVGERASALPIVGNAQTVVRDVKGKLEAELRTLVVDSDVFLDEEVSTGPNSGTRIVFKDGTNLELGENSKLRLTKLVFDPDPNKSEIAVKALVGVFRWTSGSLPSSAYHIATPVATIGIRGTSLEWVIGEDGMTTVALAKGSITVSNSRGDSVELEPNQATTVFPVDPDGSQLPPSPPGPIPANILQTIWKMTAAINLFDAPAVSDPHAGPGATVTAGGFNDQQNQVFFNPPNSGNNAGPGGPIGDGPSGPIFQPQPFVIPPINNTSAPSQTNPTPRHRAGQHQDFDQFRRLRSRHGYRGCDGRHRIQLQRRRRDCPNARRHPERLPVLRHSCRRRDPGQWWFGVPPRLRAAPRLSGHYFQRGFPDHRYAW